MNYKNIIVGATTLAMFAPVFAFAQDGTVSATVTTTPTVPYNATCASDASYAFENKIMALEDAMIASLKTAKIAKRDALKSAFLLTDETARKTALKTAQDTWRKSEETARKTFQDAMKIERDANKTTMKNCGAGNSGMMGGERGERGDSMKEMKSDMKDSIKGMKEKMKGMRDDMKNGMKKAKDGMRPEGRDQKGDN